VSAAAAVNSGSGESNEGWVGGVRVGCHTMSEGVEEKRRCEEQRSMSSGGWMAGSPQYNRRENWGSMKVGA